MQRSLQRRYVPGPLVICLLLTGLLLTACGGTTPAKTSTIGVVNYSPVLEIIFMTFKTHMAALGYVEGQSVTYIYHGVLENDAEVLGGEIKNLLNQKVDLLLTLGTRPTLAAKKAIAGTHIPVVFAPVVNPTKEGIVESVSHPGGNLTGVQIINASPKALEWLLKLVPATKMVYVPYHPADQVSLTTIKPLPDAAAQLGVELVLAAMHTPEEVIAAIAALPKDAAILFIPGPSLNVRMSAMRHSAIAHAIPAGTYALPVEDVLFSYGHNLEEQGKQAARFVDQILKGKKPADLLVETGELFLRINLKTATAIGLDIPDTILRQADTVIR
jgi:putative tryptophan/tyrosine transport system substrate-binding protein